MTIEFNGEFHEFEMVLGEFTVETKECYFCSKDEREALHWQERLPVDIKNALLELGGGIIWWRIKPEIDHAKVGLDFDKHPNEWTQQEKEIAKLEFCWKGYARFGTSPPLPDETITRLTASQEMANKKYKEMRNNFIATVKV